MAENKTLEYFDFILPSNYEGMVALLHNEEPFNNEVCLGLKQNVVGNDGYNNADNSLVKLSDNVRIFAFLTPGEFEYSQKEMLDHGDFLEDDYIEYSRLQKGLLANYKQISTAKFKGEPFKEHLYYVLDPGLISRANESSTLGRMGEIVNNQYNTALAKIEQLTVDEREKMVAAAKIFDFAKLQLEAQIVAPSHSVTGRGYYDPAKGIKAQETISKASMALENIVKELETKAQKQLKNEKQIALLAAADKALETKSLSFEFDGYIYNRSSLRSKSFIKGEALKKTVNEKINQTQTKTEQYNQEKEALLKEIIEKIKEKKSFGPVIDRFERLQNPVTGTKYSGFNRIYLAQQIENAGWKDPRFITFAQAKKLGYYLKPGQHASRVVYKEPKQKVFKLEGEELKAAQAANKPEEKTINFFVNKTFLVFNANQFKNFPELEKFTYSTEQQHEIISNMKANAAKSIKITETGVGRAFYSPGKDTITLPLPATIKNDEAAARNFFHELAHATGHESRLNRQLEYHEEEVVAELASSFLYKEFGFQNSEAGDHYSKEYIRGWAQVEKSLDENPNNLMKYVTLAEQTVAYMKEQYVDRELLLKDQLLEMPQEPAKETKIFTEQIQPVTPASIQYSIEPAKEILIELDSKNGKTFYEADRNVLDYTVAARTKNKLHEPIASFVKDYQPIGLKFRFSADTGKDPLLYGLCSGNKNVKNTLLQAIQQDIQKAAPTTVRYNQKGLER